MEAKNYRFPVYKPKYTRWGVSKSFGMEAKLQVSLSNLNIRSRDFSQAWKQKLQVSVFRPKKYMRVCDSHAAWKQRLRVSFFKSKCMGVSDSRVVWKERLQVSVSSLDT